MQERSFGFAFRLGQRLGGGRSVNAYPHRQRCFFVEDFESRGVIHGTLQLGSGIMDRRPAQSYSQDLRDPVLTAFDGGMAVRPAAATLGASPSYLKKALMRCRLSGDRCPNPNQRRAPRKLTPVQKLSPGGHMK